VVEDREDRNNGKQIDKKTNTWSIQAQTQNNTIHPGQLQLQLQLPPQFSQYSLML
jgi:hypothetical protein